jgi:hypothetical protein
MLVSNDDQTDVQVKPLETRRGGSLGTPSSASADNKISSARPVIHLTLVCNAAIALVKFLAAGLTGSAAMLAEGIHSSVDIGNQSGSRGLSESSYKGFGRALRDAPTSDTNVSGYVLTAQPLPSKARGNNGVLRVHGAFARHEIAFRS